MLNCSGESGLASPGSPCPGSSKSQTLYMWSLDAPPLVFPQHVGLAVGAQTNVKHLVLQVHYIRYTHCA